MKFVSYSLADDPFNLDIHRPFPAKQRKILEDAISYVKINSLNKIGEFEELLNREICDRGYFWGRVYKEKCALWQPAFNMSVDFINTDEKIAIEVEKTEVKRIIHDVLKLMNGSLTVVPKVIYGVIIHPKIYKRISGKQSGFQAQVIREIPFYFKSLLPHTRLNDILFMAYDL